MKINRLITSALSLGLVLLISTGAMAVGAFFSSESANSEVYMPGARVFVHRSGNREDMVVQAGFVGNASSFVWMIPVPTRPTVQFASESVFDELQRIMQPRVVPSGVFTQKPEVKDAVKPVGLGDVTVIPSIRPDTVIEWMESSGYKVPADAKNVISDYCKQGWYFVVARAKATPASEARWLQPLWISFDTPRACIPTRLASANSKPFALQLYASAKVKVKAPGLEEVYATTSPLRTKYRENEYPMFFRMVTKDTSLTELRGILDPKQLTYDIVLTPK